MAIVFWVSAIALIYSYIGYPILLAIASALFYRRVARGDATPLVTIIIPVHNEEATIERKIENTFAADYPIDKLRILIISDGSTDRTNEILRHIQDPRITVLEQPDRKGKMAALEAAMAVADGDIVIFSDAEELYEPDAIRNLVANFADPEVGCVFGALKWQNPEGTTVGKGIDLYWRYEVILKRLESRLGSSLGGVGQIYGFRRELFPHVNRDTVLEDFIIPMAILAKGYRIIYDETALAYGVSSRNLKVEFGKKARTLGGHFQAFFSDGVWKMLSPLRPVVAWQLFSHKVLQRMLQPFLLIVLFIGNLFVRDVSVFYAVVLYMQGAFYIGAALGYFIQRYSRGRNPLSAPLYFVTLNVACLVGLYRYLTGQLSPLWMRASAAQTTDTH